MKKVAPSRVKDALSKYLRLAEKEEVVITRHGKAAGILIGFKLAFFDAARQSVRAGKTVRFEDVV